MKPTEFLQLFLILWFHKGVFAQFDFYRSYEDETNSQEYNKPIPFPAYEHAPGQRSRFPRQASADDSDPGDGLQFPKGYSNVHPPMKEGNVVEFGVLVFSVREINELNMELSLELRLQIYWTDPRLQSWSDKIEPDKEFIVWHYKALEKIWLPDIYVVNLKGISQPVLIAKPASVRVYPNALLRYSTRTTLKMACPMAFKYYPADTQTCIIEMNSYAYDDQTLKVQWSEDKPLTVINQDLDLPNFDFNLDEKGTTLIRTRNNNTYSGIKIVVLLTRKLTYHLIQTYVPSALFVIVSWLSFLVPPESVPGRMAMQTVPKVSYVKALDIWMVTCIFFVFLTLLEYTIVLKLRSKIGKKPKSVDQTRSPSIGGESCSKEKSLATNAATALSLAPAQRIDITITSPPPEVDVYQSAVKTLEKYSWMIVILLFVLFNCIYWPWLILSSGHNELRNKTVYYS